MSTKTTVCNYAIAHLGVAKKITDVETDKSVEAETCKLFFKEALDECLEECRWNEATVFKTLTLVSQNPTVEWAYSYLYPSDCLYFRRILKADSINVLGSRTIPENGFDDIQFIFATINNQKVILTNEAQATAEYTLEIEETSKFSAKFRLALSFRLAYYIAPMLAKGDAEKFKARLERDFQKKIGEAQAINHNEQKFKEVDDRSPLELSRGGNTYGRYGIHRR